MKVLIVFREDKDTDNLFAPILCNAIQKYGIDIHCSLSDFWNSETVYDIIHFQWPEEVVGWNCNDQSILERLKERIEFFRSRGSRFIYTRHNEKPHYGNPIIGKAYTLIENCSDLVVHMGKYSERWYLEDHPESRNIVIPHHIYENTYDETISMEEARRKLKIPQRKFVITCFGKFRNREEINMVISAFRKADIPNKLLLAPRMLPFSKHPRQASLLKRLASRMGYYVLTPILNYCLRMRAGASEELIDNADLPYYMAASDVILIQRIDILNSGNVPLAFLFKKVVAGGDIGNVGEWLTETDNPCFLPYKTEDVVEVLNQLPKRVAENRGEENYRYAQKNMSLNKVAGMYADAYHLMLSPQ